MNKEQIKRAVDKCFKRFDDETDLDYEWSSTGEYMLIGTKGFFKRRYE